MAKNSRLFVAKASSKALDIGEQVTTNYRLQGKTWLFNRASHELSLRSGALQRQLPITAWADVELEIGEQAVPSAYFGLQKTNWSTQTLELLENPNREQAALDISRKRWTMFGSLPATSPENFLRDPIQKAVYDSEVHFSKVTTAAGCDIKSVWESGRLSGIYSLSRAYLFDKNPNHCQSFWRLVEAFIDHAPINAGPQWMCGQEASFRVMALLFGRDVFKAEAESTPERLEALDKIIQVSADRIYETLGYALNQKNNHGISETVVLLALSWLYPNWQSVQEYGAVASKELEAQLEELVYGDGSFAQHSTNYQRVMLDDLLFLASIAKSCDRSLPPAVQTALRRGSKWLSAMLISADFDNSDGLAFNVGNDDGASVLPLSQSAYRDMRPTIAACAVALAVFGAGGADSEPQEPPERADGTGCIAQSGLEKTEPAICSAETSVPPSDTPTPGPLGLWSEKPLLLFSEAALFTTATSGSEYSRPLIEVPHELNGTHGGHFVRRFEKGSVYMRAVSAFTHRPSQADQLHISVSLENELIALDPGTYAYNGAINKCGVDLSEFFNSAQAHNRLVSEDLDPMKQVSQFLLAPWTTVDINPLPKNLVGTLRNEAGLHNRSVRVLKQGVLVTDEVMLASPSTLSWLLAPKAPLRFEAQPQLMSGRLDAKRLVGNSGLVAVWASAPDATISTEVVTSTGSFLDDARALQTVGYRQLAPARRLVLHLSEGRHHIVSYFAPRGVAAK